MRFKELRQLLSDLDLTYNPTTQERRKKTHKPFFSHDEPPSEGSTNIGGRPATQGEIYRAIRKANDETCGDD